MTLTTPETALRYYMETLLTAVQNLKDMPTVLVIVMITMNTLLERSIGLQTRMWTVPMGLNITVVAILRKTTEPIKTIVTTMILT